MNILAKIVSVLFHPLLMTTYLITLFSYLFPAAIYPINVNSRFYFLLLLFVLTFLLPVINIAFFRALGVISSFTMPNRKERIKPFLLILALYGTFTYLLYANPRLDVGSNLFSLILIIDTLIVASLVITIFYKVSVHSLGIWGVFGILLPLNRIANDGSLFIPVLVTLVVAGMVMSARLQLNAHTPREVLVGSVTGFMIGFFGMLILF